MPRPQDAGPPTDTLTHLLEIHEENGTTDKLIDSGIGDSVEEELASQTGYLSGYTFDYGYELWSWDGTTLTLIDDINGGTGNSYPRDFVEFNGDVYFIAYDPTYGQEWRKLDGSTGEVSLVADIYEGNIGGEGLFFVSTSLEFNGDLYFSAHDDETSGIQLHKLDGTTGEVSMLAGADTPTGLTALNGNLYFSAVDPIKGRELHKLDGVTGEITLLADINLKGSSDPLFFTEFDGDLYFRATGAAGLELYKLDGDTGTVELAADINGGPDGSSPKGFTEFNGDLYFGAFTEATGTELFKVEGDTGAVELVTDIYDGGFGSVPGGFTEFKGDLYFSASMATTGIELFKVEGDTGRVELVADINTGDGSSHSQPHGFTEFNGDLYFIASTEETGRELYKLDAETGLIDMFDFVPGLDDSNPRVIGVVNDTLAVAAYIDIDGDGTHDRYAMLSVSGEPTSVDDFSIVDDGSGTFQPGSFLYVTDGDLLM